MKMAIIVMSAALVVLGMLMMTVPNLILSQVHYQWTDNWVTSLSGLGLVITGSAIQVLVYFKKPL